MACTTVSSRNSILPSLVPALFLEPLCMCLSFCVQDLQTHLLSSYSTREVMCKRTLPKPKTNRASERVANAELGVTRREAHETGRCSGRESPCPPRGRANRRHTQSWSSKVRGGRNGQGRTGRATKGGQGLRCTTIRLLKMLCFMLSLNDR